MPCATSTLVISGNLFRSKENSQIASYAPVALRFAMHKVNRSGEPFALCVCVCVYLVTRERQRRNHPLGHPILLFDTPHYFGPTCMSLFANLYIQFIFAFEGVKSAICTFLVIAIRKINGRCITNLPLSGIGHKSATIIKIVRLAMALCTTVKLLVTGNQCCFSLPCFENNWFPLLMTDDAVKGWGLKLASTGARSANTRGY